ncbi:hypothetical protein TWF506_003383 [Arthrobotrys conoides]|uniref:Uncharacterized protein n=1 Tax=Arthrobotrys conoides TaxID=74498 RepID=A0AAN8RJB2_9PEZI
MIWNKRELYVNCGHPPINPPQLRDPNCNEQWLRAQMLELIEERSRRTIANQLTLALPGFTTLTAVNFQSDYSAGRLHPSANPSLEIRMIRMIVRNCRSMKKLSINLNYDVHHRDDLDELETLEKEFDGEDEGDLGVPLQAHLTDLSIQLSHKRYTINLDSTYCILRMLCRILYGPARTVTRFSFQFLASPYQRDPLPRPSMPEVSNGPGLDLRMVETIDLGMQRPECCQILLPEFFHFDNSKVKQMKLQDMSHDAEHAAEGTDTVSKFSDLETIILDYRSIPYWPAGILEARKEGLRSSKELHVLLLSDDIEDEVTEDLVGDYGSLYKYKLQEIDVGSPFYCGRLGNNQGSLLSFYFDACTEPMIGELPN